MSFPQNARLKRHRLTQDDKQKALDYFFDGKEEKEIAVREYFKGSKCLYIDDREENVNAAQSVGMQGCVFRGDFKEIIRKYRL